MYTKTTLDIPRVSRIRLNSALSFFFPPSISFSLFRQASSPTRCLSRKASSSTRRAPDAFPLLVHLSHQDQTHHLELVEPAQIAAERRFNHFSGAPKRLRRRAGPFSCDVGVRWLSLFEKKDRGWDVGDGDGNEEVYAGVLRTRDS